ncbi:LRR receptor-like serine/threonine-protein kinase EFR [Forsythia ovata]|uniref:LRR receptor-like serine/threonine-protein kinase EFR n=1 Tax=Forsythia ovata TaxID=205694 RepID=A0ABD1WIK7_9LAMI
MQKAADGANQTDRAALLAFKDGITDDPFEVLRSWNESRLRILWLRNNSLDGEIPTSLSNCSSHMGVQLSRNSLIGRIPREFGSLSNLRLIRAALNNRRGSIPPPFGNLVVS